MPEKPAAAVQTAPSRPPVKAAIPKSIFERMNHLYDTISRRAFELFEKDGRVDGHDLNHWLEAEREFLHPVHIRMEETDAEFVVHAELPGFTASDVEVNVEPRRVTITGKRESKQESKKAGVVYTEQCSDEIFRTMELPTEVNTTKVTAALKDGVLDVQLPKAAATKPARVAPKAA
ncbi:MAG: Hsp20 family protein [Acidobacteriia bacterium]|nr:Hsp20 family protein [Terriglobia bacterium]